LVLRTPLARRCKAYNKTKPIQAKEFDPLKNGGTTAPKAIFAGKWTLKPLLNVGYDLDIKNPVF
jgi:type I restriction enzyme M protein